MTRCSPHAGEAIDPAPQQSAISSRRWVARPKTARRAETGERQSSDPAGQTAGCRLTSWFGAHGAR